MSSKVDKTKEILNNSNSKKDKIKDQNKDKNVKEENKKNEEDNKLSKIDKTTKKYEVMLKFINKILKNIGKKEVDDIFKFVDIDRQDIIKEDNKKCIEEMKIELYENFDDVPVLVIRKDTPSWIINVIKGMCKSMNVEFTRRPCDMSHKIDGVLYRKKHILYSIK